MLMTEAVDQVVDMSGITGYVEDDVLEEIAGSVVIERILIGLYTARQLAPAAM